MTTINPSELLDMELALAKSWRLLTDAEPPQLRKEIRDRYFKRDKKQIELAIEYDLSQSTVSKIIANLIWKINRKSQ